MNNGKNEIEKWKNEIEKCFKCVKKNKIVRSCHHSTVSQPQK